MTFRPLAAAATWLAEAGHRVLMVDRAHFPSDTVSTHCVTLGGVIQLRRWGLLDRVLATRFGLHAVDALHGGHMGQMVALHGTSINLVPLSEATAELKLVPPELYEEAEVFFG